MPRRGQRHARGTDSNATRGSPTNVHVRRSSCLLEQAVSIFNHFNAMVCPALRPSPKPHFNQFCSIVPGSARVYCADVLRSPLLYHFLVYFNFICSTLPTSSLPWCRELRKIECTNSEAKQFFYFLYCLLVLPIT